MTQPTSEMKDHGRGLGGSALDCNSDRRGRLNPSPSSDGMRRRITRQRMQKLRGVSALREGQRDVQRV
jgi:hypothetical protein